MWRRVGWRGPGLDVAIGGGCHKELVMYRETVEPLGSLGYTAPETVDCLGCSVQLETHIFL